MMVEEDNIGRALVYKPKANSIKKTLKRYENVKFNRMMNQVYSVISHIELGREFLALYVYGFFFIL